MFKQIKAILFNPCTVAALLVIIFIGQQAVGNRNQQIKHLEAELQAIKSQQKATALLDQLDEIVPSLILWIDDITGRTQVLYCSSTKIFPTTESSEPHWLISRSDNYKTVYIPPYEESGDAVYHNVSHPDYDYKETLIDEMRLCKIDGKIWELESTYRTIDKKVDVNDRAAIERYLTERERTRSISIYGIEATCEYPTGQFYELTPDSETIYHPNREDCKCKSCCTCDICRCE